MNNNKYLFVIRKNARAIKIYMFQILFILIYEFLTKSLYLILIIIFSK